MNILVYLIIIHMFTGFIRSQRFSLSLYIYTFVYYHIVVNMHICQYKHMYTYIRIYIYIYTCYSSKLQVVSEKTFYAQVRALRVGCWPTNWQETQQVILISWKAKVFASQNGGFLKWGIPNSWMVYSGKSYLNWMIFRGNPIFETTILCLRFVVSVVCVFKAMVIPIIHWNCRGQIHFFLEYKRTRRSNVLGLLWISLSDMYEIKVGAHIIDMGV